MIIGVVIIRDTRGRCVISPMIVDDCYGLISHLLSGQSLEQEKERLETRDLLNWALGQLSPAERMVLTLTYLNEYSVAASAKLLGWSIPRVKIQSHRARRKLQKILTTILPSNKGKA